VAWIGAGLPVLLLCGLVSGIVGGTLGVYLVFSSDLPKIPDLRAYRPKTVSTFYAEDGTVIGIFYKQKRFPVPLSSVPPHVINAFLAAEDARFFSHTGVDWTGVFRAAIENLKEWRFVQGGSTITQQVTRNFILTKERKISRKIREALLSFRLEKSLTKEEILELYLNEIYLGRGAYGVESAARTYFGKSTGELTNAEAALLAGLVSNPSRFSPTRNLKRAVERRNRVLKLMLRHGFISAKQHREAEAEVPRFREKLPNPYERAPYFTEAVRQYIVSKYGEDRLNDEGLQVWTTCDLSYQKKASDALLKGVRLWEKRQQRPAGLVNRVTQSEMHDFLMTTPKEPYKVGDVIQAVVIANNTSKRRKRNRDEDGLQDCLLAIPGNFQFRMNLESKILYRRYDVVELRVREVEGTKLSLSHMSLPPIQGAVVCIENRTGYVRALVGGIDFERSRFNRAAQALRQPGSSFKPFVYAAGLEWADYSPRTMIVDEPIMVMVDDMQDPWIPLNSDGQFSGTTTVRQGLVYSRNVATIKLMMDVGIDSAIRMAHRMGIQSPLGKNLSLCLGASEVTPLELTAAYSVFPNMGVRVRPLLVKKVVDRFGNVLEDNTSPPLEVTERTLHKATLGGWGPKSLPEGYQDRQQGWFHNGQGYQQYPYTARPGSPNYDRQRYAQGRSSQTREDADELDEWEIVDRDADTYGPKEIQPLSPIVESLLTGVPDFATPKVLRRPEMKRVMSPQTAYLMCSMLRDVCTYGTGARASRLKRNDLAGKTGTTDDCSDAWFIGFNPKYTTGVWVGYDTKVSLGEREYGSVAALPIWMEFMGGILQDVPQGEYPVPPAIAFWNDTWQQGYGPQIVQRGQKGTADYAPGIITKQMCPVDETTMSYTYSTWPGANYWNSQPAYLQYNQGAFAGGMVRVLSATGKDLGQAPVYMDEEGNLTAKREDVYPSASEQMQLRAERQPDQRENSSNLWRNIVPQAKRLLEGFKQFIPEIDSHGRIR
jgi:penicillin-binding protein 1A